MKNLYKVSYQPIKAHGTYQNKNYGETVMDYVNTVIIEANDLSEAKEKFHQGNSGYITGIEAL
jgi:hypothetical protein